MLRHSKKLTAGLGIVTAGLLSTGIAYAAWTSSGSGVGTAKATTSIDSVLSGNTPTVGDLYPGASKTIEVSVSNPNDYPVEVLSFSAGSSQAVGTTACVAGTVRTDPIPATTSALTQSSTTATEIAGKGTAKYTLTVRMSNSPSDDCKGATFTIGGPAAADQIKATLRSAATSTNGGNGF